LCVLCVKSWQKVRRFVGKGRWELGKRREEKRRKRRQLTGGWAAFIMPLYKRKLYTLMKPPKDLKLDEQVFQVRFTKEIFREYQYPPPPLPPPSFPPLDCLFFLFFFFIFCCSGIFFAFDSCKLWTFFLVVACCCKRMYHQKSFHFSLNFFAACHCKDTCSSMCAISGVQLSIQR
jgi:hypothetical protein